MISFLHKPGFSDSTCPTYPQKFALIVTKIVGNLSHSLLLCTYNDGAGQFLLQKLRHHIPNILPQQVVLLDFDVDADLHLPLVFLIAAVLSDVWECRKEKRACHLATIRAALEAGVNILRKSRHNKAAETLALMLDM